MFDVIKGDLEQLEEHLLQDVASPEADITEIGSHLITSGGKRIRPALCLLAAHGGPAFDLARVLPLAAALELIHTASLVHDDVIDAADTRRGAATVNAKWGNQIAILSGDFVFARAFALVAEQNYGGFVLKALADLVGNLSVGEIIQDRNVYQASRDVADYYARIQKKTADFLETCCALGGEVSGMTRADVEQLAAYGHAIGMAFQITDDLLDILETEAQTGKPAGNDIRQGILTLPVIRAMEVSPDAGGDGPARAHHRACYGRRGARPGQGGRVPGHSEGEPARQPAGGYPRGLRHGGGLYRRPGILKCNAQNAI